MTDKAYEVSHLRIIPIIRLRWGRAGQGCVSGRFWGVAACGGEGTPGSPRMSLLRVTCATYMLMCPSTLYMWLDEYKPPGTQCWHFYKGGAEEASGGEGGMRAGGFQPALSPGWTEFTLLAVFIQWQPFSMCLKALVGLGWSHLRLDWHFWSKSGLRSLQ